MFVDVYLTCGAALPETYGPLSLGGFSEHAYPRKVWVTPSPHPEVQIAKAVQSNVWAGLNLHYMHIW